MYNKFYINYNDFITGDKFKSKFEKHGIFLTDFDKKLENYNSRFIVTHSEDKIIDNFFLRRKNDFNNLKYWFGQNVSQDDSRLIRLPIGLQNDSWHDQPRKKKILSQKSLINQNYTKNRVYCNFDIAEHPLDRISAYTYFSKQKFSTIRQHESIDYLQFCDDILNHQFIICPRGISSDTHLVWETLYLKRIPVVKNYLGLKDLYEGLPVVIVEDWSEISIDFLDQKLIELQNTKFNFEKLKISYWFNFIEKKINQAFVEF